MPLQAKAKSLPLKSLYSWVLLAMMSTLALSFVVFQAISNHIQKMTIEPVLDSFDELELENARGIWTSAGAKPLNDYLTNLDRIFGGSHYLLDGHGMDVLRGVSRADLLPRAPAVKLRITSKGRHIISHRSADGDYWFAARDSTGGPHLWEFLPYYFLVIGVTGILCWLVSAGVVSPIRRIAASIALFGQGDLSTRVDTLRQDEIGQLGSSFNHMAERLQQLIVSERRLLGDISHELRSPLARLKFAIKLARTSTDSQVAFDRIDRDVDRITSLVADILEITFIEGDSTGQAREMACTGDIIEEVLRDCRFEADARGCRIELSEGYEGDLFGNRELLRRALENVLRNAIRYSPEESSIAISTSEESGSAIIEIRDYGPGVPEDALARVFDPFFRVEEARDASGGGSGLGLSIAKRAVQVHQGTIVAENASPGLRVRIAIPLLDGCIEKEEAVLTREQQGRGADLPWTHLKDS